ncbi:hypothetical protein [Treponema zioleckii]|uniref:hypothetical protein n=1 Tax=Treponema zioleckii TaxID=331680 RepID=UPI00168C0D24|nr:hypothetical protein [Treponema zioleckii]
MKRQCFLLGLIFSLFFFNSCSDIEKSSSSLVLTLPGSARAALSSGDIEKFEISLLGEGTGYSEKKTAKPGDSVEFKSLEEDVYDLTVSGFFGETKVAYGEAQTTVKDGETSEVSVKLKALFIRYYVSSSGDDESGDGTEEKPFASLLKATEFISDAELYYEIHISGELSGTQSISGEISAKSITLEGNDNSTCKLNGNEAGTTLTINTSVPVTIKNLTITGGKNESGNGGGISIGESATVTLADGAVVAGNSAKLGGGVYNEGTLFMYDSAAIGDASATEAATSEEYSNSATSGGAGLYNAENAKAYLGYSDENTVKTLTGGSCYNYGCDGAGIYNKGTVKMASGNVSYNGHSGFGVGILNDESGEFELSGGKVSHNIYYGTNGYGGGCRNQATFTMTGGEISYNSATKGAGVNARMGTFTMTGGSIKNNEGTSGKSIYYEEGTVSVRGTDTGTTDDDIILVN